VWLQVYLHCAWGLSSHTNWRLNHNQWFALHYFLSSCRPITTAAEDAVMRANWDDENVLVDQ